MPIMSRFITLPRLSALAGLCTLTLAACASPTLPIYGPASVNPNGTGYEDVRVENDRWRISYTAPAEMTEARLEELAMRRAAELAVTNNYDWFNVVYRNLDRDEGDDNPVRVRGGIGQSFGSVSGTSVGLGVSIGQPRRRDSVLRLEIIAGRGDRPEGAVEALPLTRPAY